MELTEEIKKPFSIRLRETMLYRGYPSSLSADISFTALALAASCCKTVASRYFNRQVTPHLGSILNIEKYLNLNPTFLCFAQRIKIDEKAINDTELIGSVSLL
jgi:hypothetical protein